MTHCFVADMKELAPANVNLKRLLETETQASEPILIIISPGADPSQELEDLAKTTVGLDKYHQVRLYSYYLSFERKEGELITLYLGEIPENDAKNKNTQVCSFM